MKIRLPYLLAASIAAISVFYFNTTQGLNASPIVTATSLAGQQFDFAATGGKARLVTFYSPSCAISKRDIPDLSRTHERLKNERLDIIAVAMPYDNVEEIQHFQKSQNISYPLAHDKDGSITAAFPNVRFTPTTFLIDSSGKIVWRHVGQLRSAVLDSEIDALLSTQQLAGK